MTTTRSIEQDTGKCEPLRPQWFRIPAACAASGIGRSLMYRYITNGSIKSVCLRERNSKRGIRLVNADSLFAFIESFGQEATQRTAHAARRARRAHGEAGPVGLESGSSIGGTA